jgi:RNA polymerase sigma-70 factor (ECF subfamily)
VDARREDLIRQFQRERLRLLAYLRTLVGDFNGAEDLFQEVSVAVLETAERFEPGRDVQAWCRGIARNLVRRARAEPRREVALGEELGGLVERAFEESAERELADRRLDWLRECLARLAPKAQRLVDLRYRDGLKLRQIGTALARSEGAVQVALSRVRQSLEECFRRQASRAEAKS